MGRGGLVAGRGVAAGAATIFDNGGPDFSNGYNVGNPVRAEDFAVATDSVVTGATF